MLSWMIIALAWFGTEEIQRRFTILNGRKGIR
ncbi:hypothetical protein BN440_3669 [Erwinia amylovora MR1]|nr:hypothetical protein BN440_3669 [Erwinia amylovora MR1]